MKIPTYSVCFPDSDETHWETVTGSFDAGAAAERAAADRCSNDPECYRSFEDDGMVVLVRDGGRTYTFRVTVEMVPEFRARGV